MIGLSLAVAVYKTMQVHFTTAVYFSNIKAINNVNTSCTDLLLYIYRAATEATLLLHFCSDADHTSRFLVAI